MLANHIFLIVRFIPAFDVYHKRPTYDTLKNINISAVKEKVTGCAATAGFIPRIPHFLFYDISVLATLGIDSLSYQALPLAAGLPPEKLVQYQAILNREFVNGKYVWFANSIEQDTRNHPVHTSRGHTWRINSKFALPSISDTIGYYKLTYDMSWFTPIIGDQDLVFRLHTFFGVVTSLGHRAIPFGELFHLGGPASVRGFLFGQIGPQFRWTLLVVKKLSF